MLTDRELKLLEIMENFGDNVLIKIDEKEIIKKLSDKLRTSKNDFKELQRKYSELEKNYIEIRDKHEQVKRMVKEWLAKAGEIVGNPPIEVEDLDTPDDDERDLDNDKD